MIIGLLLGVSVAISIASLGMIITGGTGLLRENLATGAVIGTTGVVSYAMISFILSLIAAFFLILILKKPEKNVGEY
jgi:hypothetical protein